MSIIQITSWSQNDYIDVAEIVKITDVAEIVNITHVAEIVKLTHVARILEAGSMYDPNFVSMYYYFIDLD